TSLPLFFGVPSPPPARGLVLGVACLPLLVRISMIGAFGLLHGWWRYTGLSDAFDVTKCVFSGSVIFIILSRAIYKQAFPRAIYLLEPLLTAGMLIGVR